MPAFLGISLDPGRSKSRMAWMIGQLDSLIDGQPIVEVSPCAKSLPLRLLSLPSPYANPCFKLGFISRTVSPCLLRVFLTYPITTMVSQSRFIMIRAPRTCSPLPKLGLRFVPWGRVIPCDTHLRKLTKSEKHLAYFRWKRGLPGSVTVRASPPRSEALFLEGVK